MIVKLIHFTNIHCGFSVQGTKQSSTETEGWIRVNFYLKGLSSGRCALCYFATLDSTGKNQPFMFTTPKKDKN
jgi:hypothetical protein